eukprot:SM000090S24296  [mRNA]  locus=s90:133745:139085:+ [translate_table: standard]
MAHAAGGPSSSDDERRDDRQDRREDRRRDRGDRDRDGRHRGSPSSSHKRSRRERDPDYGGGGGAGERRATENDGERRYNGRSDHYDRHGWGRSEHGDNEGHHLRPHPDGHRGDLHNGPRRGEGGMMTYKQFMLELEDDVSPAESLQRYEEYKKECTDSQKKAFFAQHKEEDWLKDKYEPGRLESIMARRNENAVTSSKDFLAELQAGKLECGPAATRSIADAPSDEDADHGAKRRRHSSHQVADRKQDADAAPLAPAGLSSPERVKLDVIMARGLITKLDAEKGVNDSNPLAKSDSKDDDSEMVVIQGPSQARSLEGTELLDVLLTYLWRVHGVDYYGGTELKGLLKGLRHLRSGKAVVDDNEAATTEWAKKVDAAWEARLQGGDVLGRMLGKERQEEALGAYVKKIRDEKYGWKYGCGAKGCVKLFHGPEFVLKHLRLKHAELVESAVAAAREETYLSNYLNDSEAPLDPTAPIPRPMQARMSDLREKLDRHRAQTGRGQAGREYERRVDDWQPERGGNREWEQGKGSMQAGPPAGPRFDPYQPSDVDRYGRMPPLPLPLQPDPGLNDRRHFPPGPAVVNDRFAHHGPGGPPFKAPCLGGGPEPLFDPFGPPPPGPGFPPEGVAPPPMLIPVPGAGPLGPFVPAPPEVAMRMMRDREVLEQQDGREGGHGGGPPMGGGFNDVGARPEMGREPTGAPRGGPRGRNLDSRLGRGAPVLVFPPAGQTARADPRSVRRQAPHTHTHWTID